MTQLSKIGSFAPPTWLVHASSTIPSVIDAVAFRFLSRKYPSIKLPDIYVISTILGVGSWAIFNVFTRNIFFESSGVFFVYKMGHFLYTYRECQRRPVNEKLGPAIDQLLKPFTLHKCDSKTRNEVQETWISHAEKVSGILQIFLSATDNLWVDLERSSGRDAKKMAQTLMTDSRYESVKKLFNYEEPISLPRVYRFIRGLSFVLETIDPDCIPYAPPLYTQHHTLTHATDFEKNGYLKGAKRTYNGIIEKWKPVIQEIAKIDSKMAAYLVPDTQPFPGDVDGSDNPFKLHIPSMNLLPSHA